MNNQAKNPLMYAEDSQKTKFWKWLDQNNNRTENHDDFFKEMIKKIKIVTYSCFAQLDFTPSNHEVEIRASLVLALSHLHEREKINSAELLELLKLLEIDTSTTTSFNNHESVKKNIDSDEIINKWSRQAAATQIQTASLPYQLVAISSITSLKVSLMPGIIFNVPFSAHMVVPTPQDAQTPRTRIVICI
jgi:hypothetical protein